MSGFVSLFDRVGFAHVFTFFRRAVKARAFLVVNMRLYIDPDETVATAWRRRGCGLSARRSRGRWVGGRGTGCRPRSFRFEQIAQIEFSGRRRCGWTGRCRRRRFFGAAFRFGRRGRGRSW